MSDIEVPVLIVGGSLVGMSAALLLAQHGVRALAVEYHRGTAIHPRAAQISQRTMEIFRTVGVEQIVRKKSGQQFVQDGAIMAVETLAGKELTYFISNLNEGVRDVSPTERIFISQSLLEPLLKSRAEELGAQLRFATELIAFDQDADGISATLRQRDSGQTEKVRAQYMIAADGAHSRVRERLGIGMSGRGAFSNSVTIYFRANVAPLLRGRNLSVIYVNNATLRGFFRFEKPFDSGFLAINALGDPKDPVTDVATGLTEERCIELVRIALGSESIPITIESLMPWKAAAEVADRFQSGRIFLAGDSAHIMPPNGGFGGNTGVQDAHNLAWKLASILKGKPDRELLDTYERERRPVAQFTVEQAYSRYVTRTAPYLGTLDIQPVESDLNVELGYCYEGAPHENPRESKARPGSRAPHCWVEHKGERISTLDLFGKNWTWLAGPEGSRWREQAGGADFHIIRDEGFCDAYGIGSSGAVLVRPDGFVARKIG
ncbi:MAG TPA: FAD-dependent monooxygenase [Terriglobia bacterium]|jgi:2-polyprenyl-6-methoxyphenol hydroxylase-like FAD-dependent oxidoreductase